MNDKTDNTPSSEPRDEIAGLLRGVDSLLRRCLRHGLLRAEAEAMILDIEAVSAKASSAIAKREGELPGGFEELFRESFNASPTSGDNEPYCWMIDDERGVRINIGDCPGQDWFPLYTRSARAMPEISPADPEHDALVKDAARWRWLLSHKAMPSADDGYGTPAIYFDLPDDQQGKWIARSGEDLNRIVDWMRSADTTAKGKS